MFGFGGTSQQQQAPTQGPQINAQQAAGIANAAAGVYSSLSPEMKAQVNNMAQEHATNYVKQKMGMASDPNTPAESSCPSIFGGSAPATGSTTAPTTPAAAGAVPAPAAGMMGMLGGLMGASAPPPAQQHQQQPHGQAPSGVGLMDFSSLLSFASKPAEPDHNDRTSFTHLWEASGDPPPPTHSQKPAEPAGSTGFDPFSLFSFGQQPPPAAKPMPH